MKKNILLIACMAAGIIFMTTGVYAEEQAVNDESIQVDKISYENTPVNKLGRGMINTATCWAEIPREVFEVSKAHDPLTGLTLGAAEGLLTGLLRGATGVYDAVTCIIPPYNKPIMQPEYALASADKATKSYLW